MFVKSFLNVIERGRLFKQYWLGAVIFNFIAFLGLKVSEAAWKDLLFVLAKAEKYQNSAKYTVIQEDNWE